jgi:hypothetical protein
MIKELNHARKEEEEEEEVVEGVAEEEERPMRNTLRQQATEREREGEGHKNHLVYQSQDIVRRLSIAVILRHAHRYLLAT